MKKLFSIELKKILRNKLTIFIFILTFCTALAFSYLTTGGLYSSRVLPDGTVEDTQGILALKSAKEIEDVGFNELSPENLKPIVHKYQDILNKYGTEIPNDIYVKEIDPYSNILKIFPQIYINEDGTYNYDIFKTITDEQIDQIYETRDKTVEDYIRSQLPGQPFAVEHVLAMNEKVDTPFTYYPLLSSWHNVLAQISIMLLILFFYNSIVIAPIFASEYQSGSIMITRSTKLGRKPLTNVKIKVSILISTLIYFVFMMVFTAVLLILYGIDGMKMPIQMIGITIATPMNLGQLYIISIVVGYLSMIVLNLVTLLLSLKLKNSFYTVIAFIAILILPNIISSFSENGSIFSFLVDIFPTAGVNIYTALCRLNFYKLGSISLWSPWIIMLSTLIWIPILIVLIQKDSSNKDKSKFSYTGR
ncbi:hypothetical protein [Miniphocaeibacter halophilus]|uniref:Uncharacterized protein n=1 Tax=Miniphocaeibacter halophilus TaxID=2931922 RepID=A0AC61N1I6_9FIRM|nr:hypothetical protein [Miniphocaeibacter halophilus]QQK08899.1 hypothetical protein JFY71_05015 [Miniphocaeibacter halophilus]